MADYEDKRANLRSVLERAQAHLTSALGRVDTMQPFEMAEVRGVTEGVAAFFDANGVCGGGGGGGGGNGGDGGRQLFDVNGVC